MLSTVLSDVVEKMKKVDQTVKIGGDRPLRLFSNPVSDEDAPFYSELVKNPMDLATMAGKVERLEYRRGVLMFFVQTCVCYSFFI